MREPSERWWEGWPPRDQDSLEINDPIPTEMLFEAHPYTPLKCRNASVDGRVLVAIFGGILFLVLLLRVINALKELIS